MLIWNIVFVSDASVVIRKIELDTMLRKWDSCWDTVDIHLKLCL